MKRTKRRGKERSDTTEFWYRHKYSLTVTDPRFLDATVEEMMTDYWAHHFYENPKARDEVEDEDFDFAQELARIEAEGEQNDPGDWEDVTS